MKDTSYVNKRVNYECSWNIRLMIIKVKYLF